MFEGARRLLIEHLPFEAAAIMPDTPLNDSLDLVEMTMLYEETWEVDSPDQAVEELDVPCCLAAAAPDDVPAQSISEHGQVTPWVSLASGHIQERLSERMGASYFIIPLQTFGASPDAVAAMTCLGVTPADWQGAGRFPSLTELQSRLAVLDGYRVGAPGFWNRRSWQISVESVTEPDYEYAVLDCLEYGGNPDQSYTIGFDRGSPRTMILVTRCFTDYLGTAVLLCDSGEAVLVRSETSPDVEWAQLAKAGEEGDSAGQPARYLTP